MSPDPSATLRHRVRDYLFAEMIAGRLTVGARANLPTAARALGCSVTPVREAFTQLTYSGVLAAVPNRGFVVPPLRAREARALYRAIVGLEVEALRAAAPFDGRTIRALRRANARFATADTAPARLLADQALHALLTRPYAGTAVARWLSDLKVRVFFYERAFLTDAALADGSDALHTALIDALAAGDLPAATARLRENWLNVAAVLAPRLATLPPDPESPHYATD